MKKLKGRFIFIVLFGFLLSFSACRKADTVVHVDQDEFTSEDRKIIGIELDEIIRNQTNVYKVLDPTNNSSYLELLNYLETIYLSLVNTDVVNHRNNLNWGVEVLIDDESENAFITPGGTFYITTGLLKFIQTEHELISIMGHEIMYADGDLLLNKLKAEHYGDILYDIVLNNNPSEAIDIAESLKDINYTESEVLEADIYAIDIICDFLYNPNGMKDFLGRVVADGVQMTWMHNRPSSDDRLVIIQQNAGGCGPGSTFDDRYQGYMNMLP